MIAKSAALSAIVLCVLTELCLGQTVLFYKESRNYGREGAQGEVFRREFEARMFKYANWRERLFVALYEPAVDQTLEVYNRPDGSRWLSYTSSSPSVSRILDAGQLGYDTENGLRAVRITRRQIALPADLASEIELLWQTMLPGPANEPKNQSTKHVINIHAPAFVAFVRDNGSVQTGRIVTTAIDTPAYHSFVQIVEDLLKACNGRQTNRILSQLPSKIQHLRAQLKKG
jgi:hypothetical protein